MECDRCRTAIEDGEERDHRGLTLCEDCYIDAMSPLRTCDPWAVHSAKSLERHTGATPILTPVQEEIMRILQETGEIEPAALLELFNGNLTQPQLEREFASLRHMEKVRGQKKDGKVYIRLW